MFVIVSSLSVGDRHIPRRPACGAPRLHPLMWETLRPGLETKRQYLCLRHTAPRIYPGFPRRNRIRATYRHQCLWDLSFSYCVRSLEVALRAVIMRMASPLSVCTTTRSRPISDIPNVI